MKTLLFYIILPFFALQSWSCSLVQIAAVKSTTGILNEGMAAIFEESDLILAEQSIAANMTLVEALHRSDPGSRRLVELLVQGYAGYALGFVEDSDPERAVALYRRARDYGVAELRKNNKFNTNFDESPRQFQEAVETFSDEDIPLLFWTANAWGNLINLSMADPAVIVDLHKVNSMMDFILRHDEKFFYGSAHLYFGTILATTPKVLGGNPEKASVHFEKCLEIGEKKFLLPYIYYARSYAVQTQNDSLFDALLRTVDDASVDVLPQQRLVNAIAKKKAKILTGRKQELF